MKLAKYLLIGVCYVAFIQAVAAYRPLIEKDWSRISGQEESGLEEGSRGGYWDSRRIPGSAGMPGTPEYFKGKVVKYQKSPKRGAREAAKKGAKRTPENVVRTIGEITLPKNCLVIWTADWCNRCPLMKKVGDKFKAEGFDVFYIDFNAERDEARSLGINVVPTAVVYADGGIVERVVGITRWSREQVEKIIRRVLRRNEEEKPTDYEIF